MTTPGQTIRDVRVAVREALAAGATPVEIIDAVAQEIYHPGALAEEPEAPNLLLPPSPPSSSYPLLTWEAPGRLTAAHIEEGDLVSLSGSWCSVTSVEKLPQKPVIRLYLRFLFNGQMIASKYTTTSPNKLWVVRKKVVSNV